MFSFEEKEQVLREWQEIKRKLEANRRALERLRTESTQLCNEAIRLTLTEYDLDWLRWCGVRW